LTEESQKEVSGTFLNELDIWSLRWKLAEIYKSKLENQERYYIDDLVCDHDTQNGRTCTQYFCSFGYLSRNDKFIIKTAFDAFILLSKLKEINPEHPQIEDFAKRRKKIEENSSNPSSKKIQHIGNNQIVPISKSRIDTIQENNPDYSVLNESDDKFNSARIEYLPQKSETLLTKTSNFFKYFFMIVKYKINILLQK